ncbi:MAG: dsDNA nuclease domain-containing protein [Terriglobia bacterium]|jgi:hypothetical protein
MGKIKEQVLREFGDAGADTLDRYAAQIDYTVFWCIRMLRPEEGIDGVIPEGVEDVVLVRPASIELHQIKTRDESQGPWTTNEVVPILCKQYYHRRAFPNRNHFFHFVSERMAERVDRSRKKRDCPLYRIKALLEIERDGQRLKAEESKELTKIEESLVPVIIEELRSIGEVVCKADALSFLHSTRIETDSQLVRHPPCIEELAATLEEHSPGGHFSVRQLSLIYDRLVLLVLRKIITGKDLNSRTIRRDDVLNCQYESFAPLPGCPDLNNVPGQTVVEKKAYLGGFDPAEIRGFNKQKALTEWENRKLDSLDLSGPVQHLAAALVDQHYQCRREVSMARPLDLRIGPAILALVRPKLKAIANQYLPDVKPVDEQFCLGLLWIETGLCNVWWHPVVTDSTT